MTAVFKSRAETLRFYNKLKSFGVSASTVPTPNKTAGMCGISVSFPSRDVNVAKSVLMSGGFQSFGGFY